MRGVFQKYHSLPPAERKQVMILLVFSLIAIYSYFAHMMWKEMFEAEKMANRRANRIETRVGDFTPPEIDPAHTPKALATAKKELAEKEQRLIEFNQHMIPMHLPEARERMKFQLSQLARKNQIEIIAMKTLNDAIRPLPAEMRGQELRSLFEKRPIFRISARGNYYQFINFVDAMNSLPYFSFIQNLEIIAAEEDTTLNINFDLQL